MSSTVSRSIVPPLSADARQILTQRGLSAFEAVLPAERIATAAAHNGCSPQKPSCRLTPQVVVWLMFYVALECLSMTQGLVQLGALLGLPNSLVSEEAFCQARRQLPLTFWQWLWRDLLARFHRCHDAAMRWKGWRVLAADGTKVNLPNHPDIRAFFGRPRNQKGSGQRPQALLMALCSVLTGFCVAFQFVPLRFGEHVGLAHLIRRLWPMDLLLLDRGLFSYRAIWQIPLKRAGYLIRITGKIADRARHVRRLGKQDWLVQLRPGRSVRQQHPDLPARLQARLIQYQFPGFRPSWLLTSLLDSQTYPTEELIDLYHKRWRIETIYREWKHTLDIQNLRSHSPVGLHKEIHAQLLLNNLVRWLQVRALAGTDQTPMETSFTTSLHLVCGLLGHLLITCPRDWQGFYEPLLAQIRAASIRQRPGRWYRRKGDCRVKNHGHGKYLQPSRLTPAASVP